MKLISFIGVHHFGGLQDDPAFVSSALTVQDIDRAHRERFGETFPNGDPVQSSLGYHVGYTLIIWPDGTWTQTRKVGEQTAAARGYNFNTIHVALAGNFTAGIERPTHQQEATLISLLDAALTGTYALKQFGLTFENDTSAVIDPTKVLPHRLFPGSMTQCYGSALDDAWVRSLIIANLKSKISLLQKLVLLYRQAISLMTTQPQRFAGSQTYCRAEVG